MGTVACKVDIHTKFKPYGSWSIGVLGEQFDGQGMVYSWYLVFQLNFNVAFIAQLSPFPPSVCAEFDIYWNFSKTTVLTKKNPGLLCYVFCDDIRLIEFRTCKQYSFPTFGLQKVTPRYWDGPVLINTTLIPASTSKFSITQWSRFTYFPLYGSYHRVAQRVYHMPFGLGRTFHLLAIFFNPGHLSGLSSDTRALVYGLCFYWLYLFWNNDVLHTKKSV